jgi:hypothetical protein
MPAKVAAFIVASRWASLKYAGTPITALVIFFCVVDIAVSRSFCRIIEDTVMGEIVAPRSGLFREYNMAGFSSASCNCFKSVIFFFAPYYRLSILVECDH